MRMAFTLVLATLSLSACELESTDPGLSSAPIEAVDAGLHPLGAPYSQRIWADLYGFWDETALDLEWLTLRAQFGGGCREHALTEDERS